MLRIFLTYTFILLMTLSSSASEPSDTGASEESKAGIGGYAAIGATVIAVAGMMTFFTSRAMSMTRQITSLGERIDRLSAACEAKDTYISRQLHISMLSMMAIDDFGRTCRRKLTAGQMEDVISLIKSGKILEDHRSEFNKEFDEAFINLYPTFINEVNGLLHADRRIIIQSQQSLTPELRILAFQRLGLDDTSKVAKVLGLTMNTVYTYRNKIRSRVVDRENFDRDLMRIGTA